MSYAPDWILNVVCAKVAERYVLGTLPIEAFANRMSRELLLTYADCTPEKLYSVAENMLFFLAEIEDDNAMEHFHSFTYRSVHFDKADRPRRLKGLFLDPLNRSSSKPTVTPCTKAFVRLFSDPGPRVTSWPPWNGVCAITRNSFHWPTFWISKSLFQTGFRQV